MINVTPTAASKISELLAEENKTEAGLRVFVQGGGCSGFQYGLMIDEGEGDAATDAVIESNGVKLLVDPISAPGTRPNSDSAENRPPMSGGLRKTLRYRRDSARRASSVPGSVTATNWRPAAAPNVADMCCQNAFSIDAGSMVPPLLLATRNKVRAGSSRAMAPWMAASSVVSMTTSCGKPSRTP